MLSEKEMNRIKNLNSRNHYGLSCSMLKTLITKHKKARSESDLQTMEAIEYRLTDINFHSECSLLCRGNYEEAYNRLKNW